MKVVMGVQKYTEFGINGIRWGKVLKTRRIVGDETVCRAPGGFILQEAEVKGKKLASTWKMNFNHHHLSKSTKIANPDIGSPSAFRGDDKKAALRMSENIENTVCPRCGGAAFKERLEIVKIEIEDGVQYECKYSVIQTVCVADGRSIGYSRLKLGEFSKSRWKENNCCPVSKEMELIDARECSRGEFNENYGRQKEKPKAANNKRTRKKKEK